VERCSGGAAGSRTRVPRSRSCGLYVRRSGIVSDAVLPDQAASAIHTVSGVPAALDGPSQRVEPGDVDPLPLPGVGGGSSQVFRLRGPAHRWHVEVPDVGLTRSRQAPSARSHDDGMTTVETVSAPCRGRIDALRFSRTFQCPIPTRCCCAGPDIVRHRVKRVLPRGDRSAAIRPLEAERSATVPGVLRADLSRPPGGAAGTAGRRTGLGSDRGPLHPSHQLRRRPRSAGRPREPRRAAAGAPRRRYRGRTGRRGG
jgi:hypothetical protein